MNSSGLIEAVAPTPPRVPWRHLLMLGVVLVLAAALVIAVQPQTRAGRVAVISSDFVLGGKFVALRVLADTAGVDLAVVNVDRDAPDAVEAALCGVSLAVLRGAVIFTGVAFLLLSPILINQQGGRTHGKVR